MTILTDQNIRSAYKNKIQGKQTRNTRDLVGTALGKYRLVALLGRGGMAEVYKGYQPRLHRYVAVKVLHNHLTYEAGFQGRFEREAAAVAQLRHPHIVKVYDFDIANNEIFMVMELVEGPTLKQELADRLEQDIPLTLAEINTIFSDLASAVHYAHQQGMIHRDLKPANVILTKSGQVVLTDFGIARLLNGGPFTQTGGILGTPTYMSPEQGMGEEVDARSDIYSLSIILYQMVVGRVPFNKEMHMAMLLQQINEPPPRPTTIKPDLPMAVEAVILKGLSKNPDERFQTASEMAQALAVAIESPPRKFTPIAEPPQVEELHPDDITPTADILHTIDLEQAQGTSSISPTSGRERFSQVLIVAAIVSLAILMGVYMIVNNSSGQNNRDNANTQNQTTAVNTGLSLLDTAPKTATISPSPTVDKIASLKATAAWQKSDEDRDGLTNEVEIKLNTRWDKRDTDEDGIDDGDEVEQWKTNPLQPDSDQDGLKDGVEISQGLNPLSPDSDGDATPDASDQNPLSIPTTTPTVTPKTAIPQSDTPSPTPTKMATALPTATPSPTITASPTVSASRLVLSGKLAYQLTDSDSSRIYLLNLQSGARRQIAPTGRWPTLSPDGTTLIWQGDQGLIQQTLSGGTPTQLTQDRFDMEPAISSDGKVAYINKQALYVLEKGVAQSITAAHHSPSWGPDGNWLIFDTWDGRIYKKLFITPDSLLEKVAENAFKPTFSPDRWIAFARDGDIWLMDEAGGNQQQLTRHPAKDYDPAWSPDGSKLVFISERDGNPEIYVMGRTGQGLQRLTRTTEAEGVVSWGE